MSELFETFMLLFDADWYRRIEFVQPEYFLLLLLLPLLGVWWWIKRRRRDPALTLSSLEGLEGVPRSLRLYLRPIPAILRVLTLVLIVFALARPQSSVSKENIDTEGIDIVLAIDVSSSMEAMDFTPNRLEAAKGVAAEFVERRSNDRIGVVAFGAQAFTQCPITTDHSVVQTNLKNLKLGGETLGQQTAIGMGLATAVSRLKDSEAESRIVILMTDGVNNAGSVAPVTAAELANTFGVRVYTIGVGTQGQARMPVRRRNGQLAGYQMMPVEIDEDILREIASMTDGRYFRATDNTRLQEIYTEIDQLEKTRIEVTQFKNISEEFLPFALLAGLLLLTEGMLRLTVLRPVV